MTNWNFSLLPFGLSGCVINANFLYDDFKVKQNLYSPGYHIEVLDPKKINENKPDYIIILAWRYYQKIIQKNKSYLKNGGKFILPLPEFKIINKNYLEK